MVNGVTTAGRVAKAVAHGLVGGLSSKLSGGSFSKGFLSTGFTQSVSPAIGRIDSQLGRVGAAAFVGGTASKLAGGSFSSGARLGAFSRWFNDGFHDALSMLGSAVDGVKRLWGGVKYLLSGVRVGVFGGVRGVYSADAGSFQPFNPNSYTEDGSIIWNRGLEVGGVSTSASGPGGNFRADPSNPFSPHVEFQKTNHWTISESGGIGLQEVSLGVGLFIGWDKPFTFDVISGAQ